MISDSCVQNAKQKILFNAPNYSPQCALQKMNQTIV